MPAITVKRNPFRRALRIVRHPAAALPFGAGRHRGRRHCGRRAFHGATRVVFGWDIGVGLYLILAFRIMATSDIDGMRRHAARQDEGRIAILLLTAVAALASLGASSPSSAGPTRRPPISRSPP